MDRRVTLHERKIGVGGRRGNDFDHACILQAAEAAQDVAIEAFLESLEYMAIPIEVEVRQVEEMLIIAGLETLYIVGGGLDLLLQISLEVLDDKCIGQLLGQYRRDTKRHPRLDARFVQVGESFEQRYIR